MKLPKLKGTMGEIKEGRFPKPLHRESGSEIMSGLRQQKGGRFGKRPSLVFVPPDGQNDVLWI